MARIKQKPIVALDWNTSARSDSNPSLPSALPAPGSDFLLPPLARSISIPDTPAPLNDDDELLEPVEAVLPTSDSRLAPTEKLLTCNNCKDTFPGSRLQRFRDHVESCTGGLENESDEGSATDRLSSPPESSANDRVPLPSAYSATEVDLYPHVLAEDEEAEEQPQRLRLAKLTSLGEFQASIDAAEDLSLEEHARILQNVHDAMVHIQDEYIELDQVAKTTQYPPTMSIEDEMDMGGGRFRGLPRETIKPSQKVVNPRAKPVRSDDPEKFYPTNQFQLNQDRTEAAVYGYVVKEGARDIGHQDPIGQRIRGPGQNRDLRVRQPQRNAVGDDESGDESGLNAVNDALLEGGRGKREKRPSNRVIGTNSRASSVDARVKPPRKNAKSRLADLGADHPSAAETLDSTNRWVDDVDADDGSGVSDDESGLTKPHKGPQQSYLDSKSKKTVTGKKRKNGANNDSLNGELDDDEAAAAKLARSQKRSEGAKMGWAKRKEALAAKESTQASINGDGEEGSQSELPKPEPNDASDANSAIKAAPKKKEKKMIQLADGTWIEKPSAATINMRRRWQKKREAEAKGLPPPKIGRYKKTDVILAESSSTPADFNDHDNDQVLAAVDGAVTNNRKQSGRDYEEQNEDGHQDDADRNTGKGIKKPRKKKSQTLSEAVVIDDNDTVNDDTLGMDGADEQPASTTKGKRSASNELGGPPRKRHTTSHRNTESLISSDEEDETDDEDPRNPSSTTKKRAKTGGREKGALNKQMKGTHVKGKPVLFVPPQQDLLVFQAREVGRPLGPRLGQFIRPASASNRNTSLAPVFHETNLPDPLSLNCFGLNPPVPDARESADGDVNMETEVEAEEDLETEDEEVVPPPTWAHVPSGTHATNPVGRLLQASSPLSSMVSHTPHDSQNGSGMLLGHLNELPGRESANAIENQDPQFRRPGRALNTMENQDPEVRRSGREAPNAMENQDRGVRRSGRFRKAPVHNDMVDDYTISSSPPVSRMPLSNRSNSRRNVPGTILPGTRFMTEGEDNGEATSTPAPELEHGDCSSADTQGPVTPSDDSYTKQNFKPSGLYRKDNWEYAKPGEHIPESETFPKFDRRGVPVGNAAAFLSDVRTSRRPPQRIEGDAAQCPVTRPAKHSSKPPVGGAPKKSRTRGPTPVLNREGSVALSVRTASPAPRAPLEKSFSNFLGRASTPAEADRDASTETKKARANGTKGKGKAKQSNEAVAARLSRTPSRETPSQPPPGENESVTGSGGRPHRSTQGRPPKRLDEEVGELAEKQRQKSRSPSGANKTGQAKERMGLNEVPRKRPMEVSGAGHGEHGVISSAHQLDRDMGTGASGSASTKNNKGKGPRKSDAKPTKNAEADSPVASIEENDDDMNSSQKTIVDPDVAEALAKREAARQAKSEKMKAITKARWASGEMQGVMEKKKANNRLRKEAATKGAGTVVNIAPAPISMPAVTKATKGAATKEKSSVSQSPAPPITPTLGSFAGKGKTKGATKPEGKKEPRAKELAKAEGAASRRSALQGFEMEMDAESDEHGSDDEVAKKPTQYDIFMQLSSGGALEDSGGRAARARSIAVNYEGRRSGRGGSLGRGLGGVGGERGGSDDGLGGMRGTPASVGGRKREGKTVTRKLSEYEQFQQLSSPTTAGSPLPPRGRRPAALRATQTFQSLNEDDDEVEEETIPYAGPAVHLGHSRNNSRTSIDISQSGKKDKGKGKGKAATLAAMKPPQPKETKVKREEVELGDEESEEEGESPKTKWDEWQELMRSAAEGEGEEGGKRKRVVGRRSDVGGGR